MMIFNKKFQSIKHTQHKQQHNNEQFSLLLFLVKHTPGTNSVQRILSVDSQLKRIKKKH